MYIYIYDYIYVLILLYILLRLLYTTSDTGAVISPAGSPPPVAGGGREARLTSDATGGEQRQTVELSFR